MKRRLLLIAMMGLAISAPARFKAKTVKAKKPEQFQTRIMASGVTFAADLLLRKKDQEKFFYRELASHKVIALRLAVFNGSQQQVIIEPDSVQLIGPDGKELSMLNPETVAEAMLQGFAVHSAVEPPPVQVQPSTRSSYPRSDRTDPNYDPRLDPSDPQYDPADPRNAGYNRRVYGTQPGVDVVLNPGGGRYNVVSRQLIRKDFIDKAFSSDPILPAMMRDRFIYFSHPDPPPGASGFKLRVPLGKETPELVTLEF